jgi:glycerol-3-phosphate cytidylyltransferase
MITVLTMGTFDLPHPGHVALLRECRRLGDRLVVGVSTDAFVERWKHKTPVMTCEQRMDVLAAIRYVDDVVENDGADQAGIIEAVRADVLAIGADWAGRDYHAQLGITPAWLEERGIDLRYVTHEHTASVSTSMLRARMEAP